MNIKINPSRIYGNWIAGWTLDLHTVSSRYMPDGSFETARTELGELLYQLKYRHDKSKIRPIAQVAAEFIKKLLVYPYLDAIIPIPPSDMNRPFQPVIELAAEIGRILNLPAPSDYLVKVKPTVPLKSLEGYESRQEQLKNAFTVQDNRFYRKYVLLFDDIYRSGETLKAATDVLIKNGEVSRVYVLALTRTKTKT